MILGGFRGLEFRKTINNAIETEIIGIMVSKNCPKA